MANQTELIARCRRNAFIPTGHPTYPDQVVLDELNDALRSIYEDLITIPRQGHWLKQYTFASVVGQANYRITPRAVIGGVEKVEIGQVNGDLSTIDQVGENHAQLYESFGGRTGMPSYYAIRGDQLEFLPAFNSIMTVRVSYYIRPSKLIIPQTNGVSSGLISGLNLVTRQFTVPVSPLNNGNGSVINTATPGDVVHPNGSFELAAVSITPSVVTGAGPITYTFPVGTDLSEVQDGDFFRWADQTDWPALPEEFHRTVADTAAIKILLQLNNAPKAQALAQSVAGDLLRLQKLIEAPRTRRQPKRLCARLTTRGGGIASNRWRP